MGQKVNPVGFRLGINRGWDSVWYAKKKDFGNYLIEDFKIREYICLLYTSPSPRDKRQSRMPSSA